MVIYASDNAFQMIKNNNLPVECFISKPMEDANIPNYDVYKEFYEKPIKSLVDTTDRRRKTDDSNKLELIELIRSLCCHDQ